MNHALAIELHIRFIKKEAQIATALYRDSYPETLEDTGFTPIGLDEPYRIVTTNNPINYIDPLGLKVYKCCRDVQVNPTVNKVAQAFGYQHCFIKTDTKEAGMGPADGGPLPSYPFGIKTKITAHAGQAVCSSCHPGQFGSPTCTEIPDVDEDCVNKELQLGKNTGRWLPWNQCNTLVKEILKKCKKKNCAQ